MTVENFDICSIHGINPDEWHFMYVRDLGLDQIVIQPPHAQHHFKGKCNWAEITKPNGDVFLYPAFKGEIMQSPGVIDSCALAPFSEYESMGYRVELSKEL